MPIANYTHSLPRNADGDPVYIIKTPVPVTRKFMGVHFIEGEGRTKFAEKAKRFDENFGYTVILAEGVKPWQLVTVDGPVRDREMLETELEGRWEDEEDDEKGWSKTPAAKLPTPADGSVDE